ncbi:putative hydrolase of the HAD superfamily [Tessaracoccus bendigoensis DSM 12906]|uniref:Putative hydrolase of the HAD superfamily n=1 Tax=Tessaracoccus bendigoensis DSM 12906 TaxID=1123357 RepID=A0A1M6N3B2_9ACTN|nr:HAD-IA family hydrolase [Tessaracoccus bendigoensis]SHJ90221.1 putative hydrolase of the HAD superfamily [Tessaracoccus bendigoensis DSM 12906]
MIHAVVFDLGEVLSSPPSLLPELAKCLGVAEDDLATHYWEGRAGYDSGAPDADYWGPLLEAVGVKPEPELIVRLAMLDASIWSELRPTARQLLREVRATGVTVAVASNSPHAMQKAAEAAPWRRDINQLFVSATIGAMKPAPRFFDHVTSRLELDGNQIAFVDDKQENVDAAAKFGWRTHLWVSDADTRVWLTGLGVL